MCRCSCSCACSCADAKSGATFELTFSIEKNKHGMFLCLPCGAKIAIDRHVVKTVASNHVVQTSIWSYSLFLHDYLLAWYDSGMIVGRPMSCVPGYFDVINTHTVGFLTIPRASIKWV